MKSTDATLRYGIYKNNLKAVPAIATLTIYKPSSRDKLLDAVTMSIAADGELSYALTAANLATAALDYECVINYTLDTVLEQAIFFMDVVNSKPTITLIDDDILNELPQLRDKNWRVNGTASSGTTTTIVSLDLSRFPDDYFTGGLAFSIDKNETREITGFVASTGALTTKVFSAAISTDKFILSRSFSREIKRAFEKLVDLLAREGKRAHLIIDSNDLRECHIIASVAEVCKGLIAEGDGLWFTLWEKYEARWFSIYKSLNFKYDASMDGFISGAEKSLRNGSIMAKRQ